MSETNKTEHRQKNWNWWIKQIFTVSSMVAGFIVGRYFVIKYQRKTRGLPDGVIGLPIFGCLFSLAFYPKKLLKYCGDKYSKKNGGICSMRLGNTDIVVVNTMKLYKNTNISTQLNLDRPIFNKFMFGYPSFAMDTNGKQWKIQRNMVKSTVIQQNTCAVISKLYTENINNIIIPILEKHVKEDKVWKPGKSIDFLTFCCIYKSLFEDNINNLDNPKFNKFRDGINGVLKQFVIYCIVAHLPSIFGKLIYNHNIVKEYNTKYIHPMIRESIENRKKYLKNNNNKCITMIDYMLLNKDKLNLSDENIIGNVAFLMGGGMTSTSLRAKHAIYNLALYPEIYDKLYNELINIYPNKIFTFDKINLCNLLKAFVYESIRTSTDLKLSHTRIIKNKNGMNINGYNIPQNTLIMFNIYYMEYIENNFKYAHTICLDHFIDKKTKNFKINDNFTSFGIGKRNCVGQLMALKQIYIILSTLILKGYKFSLTMDDPNYKLLKLPPLKRNVFYPGKYGINDNKLIVSKIV